MSELSAHDRAILNCIFNPNLPLDEAVTEIPQEVTDVEDDTPETVANKQMEIEAIRLAESGDLHEGLALINRAISAKPNRPSLYNNRAHILQFLRRFDDAIEDLTKAIVLCTENHKKTLCQAHCQRGLLRRRFEQTDLAREDFQVAAKLGDSFAKSQLVELNPYAALCNQMLKQVMETLK